VAIWQSSLMRIRRRDRDPVESGGSAKPSVVPYDYDQEAPEAVEPEPGPAGQLQGNSPMEPESRPENPAGYESAPPVAPQAGPAGEPPVSMSTAGPSVGSPEPVLPPTPPPAQTEPTEVGTSPAPAVSTPAPIVDPGPDVGEAGEAVDLSPASAEPTAGSIAAPGPEITEPEIAEPEIAEPEIAEPEIAEPVIDEPKGAPPQAAPPPPSGPKHAMRTPSIGEEATELLSGFKPAPRELPRIIAIANQKGGVGKTTTTVNLGAALAELDYRVLVIDLDPQGNATTGLGVEARNFELSMYDVIMRDQPLEDCIEPTSVKNLFVAPATIDLAGVEIELVPAFSRELKLKRAVDTVVDDFDFVLIDCPPSLGLITVNGLAAADEVLVPIQCEYYALEGLSQLLRNVNLVSTNLNQTLEVSTIVLTMYDARTRLSVDVANEVREHFSERVCRAVIPRTVRLSEAPSFGQPITVFDPASRGAVAYRELAKEVSNGAPQRSR
jgi:chromosome partitioning protein